MNLFKPPLPNAREHGTIPTCLSGLSWELKDTIWVTVPGIVPGARINPWNLQGSNQSLPRSPSGFTCCHHVQSYEVFDMSMAGLTWTSQARMLQNLRGRGDVLACVQQRGLRALTLHVSRRRKRPAWGPGRTSFWMDSPENMPGMRPGPPRACPVP